MRPVTGSIRRWLTTRRPRWRPSFTLRGLAQLPLGWDVG